MSCLRSQPTLRRSDSIEEPDREVEGGEEPAPPKQNAWCAPSRTSGRRSLFLSKGVALTQRRRAHLRPSAMRSKLLSCGRSVTPTSQHRSILWFDEDRPLTPDKRRA